MKTRILAVVAFLLLPIVARADSANRDVILTPDGTLFTIESVPNPNSGAYRYLLVNRQQGETVEKSIVPATLLGGDHTLPALAYDGESKTLFVFWQKSMNAMSTELLFCSFHDGQWSDVTSLGSGDFRYRFNLRIAVTSFMVQVTDSGEIRTVDGLTVHAVWWEQTGTSDAARYAMLPIVKGVVTDPVIRDLAEFVSAADKTVGGSGSTAADTLQQPVIFPAVDSVDVLFGEIATNKMYRVTLKPISDGRVRIPIGVKGDPIPTPRQRLTEDSTSRVSAVSEGERIALYSVAKDGVHYMVYDRGEWSPSTTISTNENVSSEAAVEALRRLVAGH